VLLRRALVAGVGLALATGCATPGVKDGGVLGALGGTAVGAVAGNAAIGAGAGLALGALVGKWIADPEASGPDRDEDQISDAQDNCPDVWNKGQQDSDGDGRGDACSPGAD
jgi:hypothetical protein